MPELKKYEYSRFSDYMVELMKKIPQDQKNEINKKIKDSWIPSKGNIINTCKNAIGKYYTGYDESRDYLLNTYKDFPDYEIPKIPKNCKNQVVIGIGEYIKDYFKYIETKDQNKFLISSDMDWTEYGNNLLIRCGTIGQLNDCKFPLRILLPKDNEKLITDGKYRITVLEMLTFKDIFENEQNADESKKLKNNLWILETEEMPYDIIFVEDPNFEKKTSHKKTVSHKKGGKTRKLKSKKNKTNKRKNKK